MRIGKFDSTNINCQFPKDFLNLHVLVLAGGGGTRLWPCSRENFPKQFLKLGSGHTLMQQTLIRLSKIIPPQNISVVVGTQWVALTRHQISKVLPELEINIVEEPCARNTGPAVALGLFSLIESGAENDDLVFVCPSDHSIKDENAFFESLKEGMKAAHEGYLTVFGIAPDYPETGFGYIRLEKFCTEKSLTWTKVNRFVEKPNLETAEKYLEEKCYLWNAGMLIFRLGDMLEEIKNQSPEIGTLFKHKKDIFLKNFGNLPSVSIDYAVLEKSSKVAAVPLEAGWSDIGSWDALYNGLPKDNNFNAISGDVVIQEGKGNLIWAFNKFVAGINLQDLIVVDTLDALLIAPRKEAQKVRDLVNLLKQEGRQEVIDPPSSVRPWGKYTVIFQGERFKIKKIVVEPGRRLSLQYHRYRAEHWVVVRGTAQVTLDEKKIDVHEGESAFVPQNMRHRLENLGDIPLEIVEIQLGEYLGEDDIVRIKDDFLRDSFQKF